MKPAPFEYTAPDTLDEALSVLAEHGDEAKILAGGQSLVPMMNFRLAQPSLLVDCNRLGGLELIRASGDGGLAVGAMTRVRQLERDPQVASAAPLVHETVPYIAHSQIRNRGTVGGSLAHADPASELPALALARGFSLRLQRAGGERWVEAGDFFTGLLETALEPEEMVTEVVIPPMPPATGWAFTEVSRRHGDYAQVGVAALVTIAGGVCSGARLVYLSVGETPMVATRAAGLLRGERLTAESFQAAAEMAAANEIEPAGDIHATEAYKRHLARVLTVRVLETASERAMNGAAS